MTITVRAFVAIELSEDVSMALEAVQEHLQSYPELEGVRWVDPYDSHITLKFLGEIEIPALPTLVEALDTVAERWEPFTIGMAEWGAFPNVSRPSVLWVGVNQGDNALKHLYNAVEVALKKHGIKPEREEFFPHITLARLPKEWSAAQREAAGNLIGAVTIPDIPVATVEAVALIRSVLTPGGAEYTRLGNSRFNEAPPLQADDWEDEE